MRHYSIQLQDHRTGAIIQASGGVCYVAKNADAAKETLYQKDGTSQSNVVSLTQGNIDFYVADSVNNVDLYIMAPSGEFVVLKDVEPSGPNEIFIDQGQKSQAAIIPFSATDFTAASETDTGFDEPANALFLPHAAVRVSTVDATETIDVGTDSTASGDANGFIAAVSVATAGVVKATIANGGNTLGALFEAQDSANAGDLTHEAHVSTSKSITYTPTAGSDTAEGFIILPYVLTA